MNKKKNLVAKMNLAEARAAADRFEALRKQELDKAQGGLTFTRVPDDGTVVFTPTPGSGDFTIRPVLRW